MKLGESFQNKIFGVWKMGQALEGQEIIDVRLIPHSQRHQLIMKKFNDLLPGKDLLVVNDHEPVHLYHYMKHERKDFDAGAYRVYQKDLDTWIGVFKKSAHVFEQTSGTGILTSFDKEQCFDEKGFSPVPIYSTNVYKVILTYFKAGQFIPVHEPKTDLVFVVYKGQGEIVTGDKHHKIIAGDIVIIPSGEKRGIKAETDMQALHLVSPPPTDEDHEMIGKKLQNNQFE